MTATPIPVCGNSIPESVEQCDDGNLINDDTCDNNCRLTCGNGILTAREMCDDSNLINGDGCSSTCQRELLNPIPAAGDHFGAALATVGPNVIIGVPLHDQIAAINTGIAYLFSGTTFQPIRIFENPTPNPGDEFGFAVAAVGQSVLVGAPYDSTVATEAGAAYLFDGVTGALIRTILNPNASGSKHFGWSLAALDATTVLIGAPLDDFGLAGGGVAYLFNAATGSLLQVYLNPTPAGGDEFGYALTVVGSDVLIGAPGHDIPADGFTAAAPDAGTAYLFHATTGALEKTIEDPLPVAGDRFGQALGSLGPDLLVSAPWRGAGTVYRLDAITGAVVNTYLSPVAFGDDRFGNSVATIAGNRIIVGAMFADAPTQPRSGVVQVFDADSAALLQTVTKAVPAEGDEFGYSVAASGSHIVVGAPRDDAVDVDAGAVYFFRDNSCGNGVRDPAEQCDDGNIVDSDGCDSNCTVTGCGNGVVTAPEQCDDGNNTAGDGCSPTCGLEGACGDGIKSTFEQCDDGNVVSGDGCDSNCTITTCGNGIVTAGEQCDKGPANGTDLCCSASCQRVDTDGDGFCDSDDVCPNTYDPLQSNIDGDIFGDACDLCPSDVNNDSDGDLFCTGPTFNPPAVGGIDVCSRSGNSGAWSKPRAFFLHLGPPLGDDSLRLQGLFSVGNLVPTIQPDVYGVQVRVTDRLGRLILGEKIPGGWPSPLRGWKAVGSPAKQWIYVDRTKPPVQNGIAKIKIRNRTLTDPKLFSVAVQGNGGNYSLQPGDEPLRVTFELNTNAIPAGGTLGRDQCGEMQFLNVGTPSCRFLNNSKVSCK